MNFGLLSLEQMPVTAKKAIAFWLLGWGCLLTDYYLWTADKSWLGKMAIAIGLLTFFMLRAQNWSRMIGMMASAMALLFSAILVYAVRHQTLLLIFSAASLIAFTLSLHFLISKPTARFFKSHSSSDPKEDADSSR